MVTEILQKQVKRNKDEKENRIFENVFNKINNTNDPDNMWCTKLKKHSPLLI